LENPSDFPLVRSTFIKLVAETRNYPYTRPLCIMRKKDKTLKI
jgi:hypothetical protein